MIEDTQPTETKTGTGDNTDSSSSACSTQWYVCSLDRYNSPDFKQADGPHDNRKECEQTIALMNSLNMIENKKRVICEVRIHEGVADATGLNKGALDTLNSL